MGGMMAREFGAWPAVGRLVRSSRLSAPLRRIIGFGIILARLPVLVLLVLRNLQVLEEDVRGTFWASAPGYALAHCGRCQRQRIIRVHKSDLAPTCSGGRLFRRHPATKMGRFASGSDGFDDENPWHSDVG